MKRKGYIMPELCENDNLEKAYRNSKKGKTYVHNMLVNKEFDPKKALEDLQQAFIQGTYRTSDYTTFKVYEPKERTIYRLPYAPDRIAHHAIMNVMEEWWVNRIPNVSYSCIKGRGISAVVKRMKRLLKTGKYKYCLQMDIKKYFPSINHEILKSVITKYIKDKEFLEILYEIIDSTDRLVDRSGIGEKGCGVPIGNYCSQFFANLYLAPLYQEIQKNFDVKIFIYMDDIVILSDNKMILHKVLRLAKKFTNEKLALTIKKNWQIYPIAYRGISFVGYRFFTTHTLLRQNIKLKIYRLIRKLLRNKITRESFIKSMYSYYGWLKVCNSKKLLQGIYNSTGLWLSNFKGKFVKITDLKDKFVNILHVEARRRYFIIQGLLAGVPIETITTSKIVVEQMLNETKMLRRC